MFSETTTSQLWKTNPPTYSFMSIARHQSFFISGSQTRYYGFSEILPVIMIIDTGNACAEKTTLEARCSIIYNFVILILTWTEYDINAPIYVLSGLRVRITADGKGRYTLLLGFPLFIIFEAQNGCFHGKIVSLIHHTHSIVSLNNTDSEKQKRKRQRSKILKCSHFQKVQPACTQSIKLHVCVGVACNAFCLFYDYF